MDLLRSLLRRRFARAQVATSRDGGCFLRLGPTAMKRYDRFKNKLGLCKSPAVLVSPLNEQRQELLAGDFVKTRW